MLCKLLKECGGQGRNRTAAASLFRAAGVLPKGFALASGSDDSVLAIRSPLSAANHSSVEEVNGGQGRNRTADASLFRAALYQLSYLAILS
jgi:hypothetical protein